MILSKPSLMLLAEALRAVAQDLDAAASGDVGRAVSQPINGANSDVGLTEDELAQLRADILELIRERISDARTAAEAGETVKTILAAAGAAKVSELTAGAATIVMAQLRAAFPG